MPRSYYRRKNRTDNPHPRGPVYGAIDLGTNSCRLLLAEPTDTGFQVVDGFSQIVRLGEGMSKSGRLSDSAMERTLVALKKCAKKAKDLNAIKIRCIATEACRRAENGMAFLTRIKQQTGLSFEIVTPEMEAELTLSGCVPLLKTGHKKALIFDIGGGSTEIMWIDTPYGHPPHINEILSFPMGVVTLVEDYGTDINRDDLNARVRARITKQLEPFSQHHHIQSAMRNGDVQIIGTSGTATTLGAIYLGLQRYDRARVDGLTIPFENIHAIAAKLTRMDNESRRQIPCIGTERADLMLMGCAILTAICTHWPTKNLRAADRGIREGILMGMIDQDHGHTPTVTNLGDAVATSG